MIDFTIAGADDLVRISEMSEMKFSVDTIFFRGKQNDDIILWFGFKIIGNEVEILDISAQNDDGNLMFFCGKAGLNALDLSNFRNVFCRNESLKEILLKLGFNKDKNNIYRLTLTDDYFKAGCKH